jgi:hypothetical protein
MSDRLTGDRRENIEAAIRHYEAALQVRTREAAPHDWLFTSAALVVHHGGAGTTGRAAASGVPSLVIPVLRWADQPQWGRLVHRAGVGVLLDEPGAPRSAVRAAIAALNAGDATSAPFTRTLAGDAANRLGSVLRAETSAESAIAVLEACLCNAVLPPAQADAIHPLAGPLPPGLTAPQRMCARHCLPCRALRARLTLADTPLFRTMRVAPPPRPAAVLPPRRWPERPPAPASDHLAICACPRAAARRLPRRRRRVRRSKPPPASRDGRARRRHAGRREGAAVAAAAAAAAAEAAAGSDVAALNLTRRQRRRRAAAAAQAAPPQ